MKEISNTHPGVSKTIMAAAVIVIIAAAAGGYIYYTNFLPGGSMSSTFRTGTFVASNLILNGSVSAGFYKGTVVSFKYSQNFQCIPALNKFVTNQTEGNAAAAKTACVVGGGDATALAGAAPVFILVPAYAGLSIFGVPALGATSQGYPTFNGNAILTQCGAGGTVSACSDHPTLIYSPYFTAVEQHIGIKTGYGGLPEGVLPTPSHDHIVDYSGGPSIPWDVIAVLVFDPNIMPDGQTGQCHQWVQSDLANPTANCLTSFTALTNALTTKTSATANANSTQSDPIYSTLGGVPTQVAIPGVTIVSQSSPANTNLFLWFAVSSNNPFGG
ncbi:MAG: hypothetical protein LYZ70_03815 [Nitrososphaerales archaeon]|nr:hypothetical protein [Nitrososphaerales archaeon]